MIWEYMKGEPMRLIDADKLKVYRCDSEFKYCPNCGVELEEEKR